MMDHLVASPVAVWDELDLHKLHHKAAE